MNITNEELKALREKAEAAYKDAKNNEALALGMIIDGIDDYLFLTEEQEDSEAVEVDEYAEEAEMHRFRSAGL